MYTVWHVDRYKITFKLVINQWANKISVTDICYTDFIYPFWSELFDLLSYLLHGAEPSLRS
jgi:hypothetical protein